jgi:hypothetical protein
MADTNPRTPRKRYDSLADYVEAQGLKKWFVAQLLGVSRFQFAGLLYPGRYPVTVDDALAARIADLLNQPVSYVRKLYPKAA